MQLTHFFKQGVKVCIRICHLGADFVVAVKLAFNVGDAFFYVTQYGFFLIEDRLLHEDTYRVTGAEASFAVGGLI